MLKRLIRNRAIRLALRSAQSAVYEASKTIYREIRFSSNLAQTCHAQHCLLNVGCGDLVKDGWLNVDAAPASAARYYYNAVNPLPLRPGSVEHIHAEHFLEHLEYFDACQFIHECFRVLKVGGSFRVVVPDLEKYINAYYTNDREFFTKFVDLGGAATPLTTRALVCNQMFRMGGAHKFAWDFETLADVLEKTGFRSVERSKRSAVSPKYQIDGEEWWREVESLYVNARK
jgi:predicted SAM-dependent methyltransferase